MYINVHLMPNAMWHQKLHTTVLVITKNIPTVMMHFSIKLVHLYIRLMHFWCHLDANLHQKSIRLMQLGIILMNHQTLSRFEANLKMQEGFDGQPKKGWFWYKICQFWLYLSKFLVKIVQNFDQMIHTFEGFWKFSNFRSHIE